MGQVPWSDKYAIDPSSYAKEREERMIQHLDEFFWKCFFYLRMNRIEGDYLEFGCGSNVRSFRLAAKYRVLEYPRPRLFAFDSFQGLPEPMRGDVHPQWKKGGMVVSLEEFREVMRRQGVPDAEYSVIPGFFEESLGKHTPGEYGISGAAMVFVDCDLYESTVSVLSFAHGLFAEGAILAFDDWYCFAGAPDRGEQRAFNEFRSRCPDLQFTDFLSFGWHGRSLLVHPRT